MNTNLYEGQDLVLPIVEEQLRIGKRAVERGGVRVRTHVEDVPVNEQVTLRDETVAGRATPGQPRGDGRRPGGDARRHHRGDETDEEAVVSKEARVVEEVVVRKDAQERTETVQDSVRRTQVDVDEMSGQTTTSGATQRASAQRWSNAGRRDREHDDRRRRHRARCLEGWATRSKARPAPTLTVTAMSDGATRATTSSTGGRADSSVSSGIQGARACVCRRGETGTGSSTAMSISRFP